jgi:hypothetical protein
MDPRTRLAAGGIGCTAILLVMLVMTPVDQWGTHRVLGFVFKLALTIGALWLAWPDLVKMGHRLPPKFVWVAAASLLMVLIQPRFGALLILGTIIYAVGWWAYRKAFPPRRDPKR